MNKLFYALNMRWTKPVTIGKPDDLRIRAPLAQLVIARC